MSITYDLSNGALEIFVLAPLPQYPYSSVYNTTPNVQRGAVRRFSKKLAEHFSILKRTYPEYEVEEEKQIFKALSSTPHSHFCICRWFQVVFLSSVSSQDDLALVVMACVSNSPRSLFPLEFDCVNLQKSGAGERMLPPFACVVFQQRAYTKVMAS